METVKLLWDCARQLKPDCHTNKLLKTNYMMTCRKISASAPQVTKEKFSVTQMCPHCLQFWSENEYDLKLKPQQLARSSKAKKLIEKLEKSQQDTNTKLLTGKQRKRAKWLKKKVTSKLKISCNFCKHTSEIPLEKPNEKQRVAKETVTQKEEQEIALSTPATKKKKKPKDRTAGLKIDGTPKTTIANKPPEVAKGNPLKNKPNTKTTPALSTPLKAKKKNKNKGSGQQATPVAPKIQSKTQHKNSLLQLASLLKNQAAKPKATQNRLDSFLQ